MGDPPSLPLRVRLILTLAGLLAPARHRSRFRREWEAELRAEAARDRRDRAPLSPSLTGLAFGALADARALRHLDPATARTTTYERMTMAGRQIGMALRALARAPGFSALGGLTLAVGIAATTSMFAVVDHVLLRPLPYDDPDALVDLSHPVPGFSGNDRWGLSVAGYFHLRERTRELASVGAWMGYSALLTPEGRTERVPAAQVTASFFETVGAEAALGRLFDEADDEPGAPVVGVLGHDLWLRAFGADPGMVGRAIQWNGQSIVVVGVASPDLHLPRGRVDLWTPWRLDATAPAVNSHYVATVGRLAPGSTVESARAEWASLTRELPDRFPGAYGGGFMEQSGFGAAVTPLRSLVLGGAERPLWILLGAVALVLTLACANVANLFLVRTEDRAREVAVRRAMGASGGELARHFLSESLGLTVVAGAAGVALAVAGLPFLKGLAPEGFPRLETVAVDGRSLAFAVGAALLTGLILGILPLLRHGRAAPAAALGEGSRGNAGGGGMARKALVAVQMALAVVLLAGAGLMVRTAGELREVDPGFDPAGAMAVDLVLPWWEYESQRDVWAFTSAMLEGVRALPGVTAAGLVHQLPMEGPAGCWAVGLEDGPRSGDEAPPCPVTRFVSDGYFEAMGIPPVEGRTYEPTDDRLRTGSMVVSETLAAGYWPEGGHLGRGIRIAGQGPPYHRVVGVVGDVRDQGLTEPAPGVVYVPMLAIEGEAQWGPMRTATLVVRAPGRALPELLEPVRQAVRSGDAGVAVLRPRSLDDVVAGSMVRVTFTVVLLTLAAGVAVVLGAVGLYAVVSYAVSRRGREIGIRMALGAAGGRVAGMVLRESFGVVILGGVLGLAGALVTNRFLESMLFGVSPSDPLSLVGASALLALLAAVAAWLPARRAAGVDPAVSLRSE